MRLLFNLLFLLLTLATAFWLSHGIGHAANRVAVAHVEFDQGPVHVVVNPFEDLTGPECEARLKEFKHVMTKKKHPAWGKSARCLVQIVTRERA